MHAHSSSYVFCFPIDLREREGGEEGKEGGTSIGCFSHMPDRGSNLQPRNVLQLTEPQRPGCHTRGPGMPS